MRRPSVPLKLFWGAFLALVFWLRWGDAFGDEGMRNVLTFMSTAVCLAVSWIWLLLRAGLAQPARLKVLWIPPAVLVLFVALVRVDGFSGAMIPSLSWRAAQPATPRTGHIPPSTDHGGMTEAGPNDFPGFLGLDRHARADGTTLAPDWTSAPPKLLWRHPVGLGWSGFAVVGDLAVTMEERESSTGLYAYSLTGGEPLWAYTWPGRFDQSLAGPGPRCTPSIAAGRVLAQDAHGFVVCVSAADGSLLWDYDLREAFGVSDDQERQNVLYGRSNSPLVTHDMVILPGGGEATAKQVGLIAFDLTTGDVRWESPARQQSYASPTRATLAGVDQILTVNEGSLSGHDPENGMILWEHPWPSSSSADSAASQAVPLGPDGVLISKGYGMGAMRLELSVADSGQLDATPLWHERRLLRTKLTNIVIHEGYAYGLSDGILECVDLAAGQRVWKGGRYGHGQVLGTGELLLVQTEEGRVVLRAASPNAGPGSPASDLGSIDALDGKAWNNMALAGDVLLVRNAREASAWRLPTSKD